MTLLALLLTILALTPLPGSAAVVAADSVIPQKARKSQDSEKKYYAVLLTKGPAYVKGGPQPGMAEHVVFIKALHADGVVPLAGALFEEDHERTEVYGLLYFVRAGSLQEVRGVVMKEPLVQEKVAKIESIWVFAHGVGRLD